MGPPPPPVPRWLDLPTSRREELLRILGRMLAEQIVRPAEEVTNDAS
jgi:hypothetical protein